MKEIFIVIVLCLLVTPVFALKLPWEYGPDQCELIAKDYRAVYGGQLVLIQPLKDNGAYDLGKFNGHWINKVPSRGGYYFYDYQYNRTFQNKQEILSWYMTTTGRKAVVFDLDEGHPPFSLHWYY
jgi:hypothetical protein